MFNDIDGGLVNFLDAVGDPKLFSEFYEIMLSTPQTEAERVCTLAAVNVVESRLAADGMTSVFTLAPADDVLLASVYVANGYRRSAVLAQHLCVGGQRKDAIVWSKKFDLEN